MVRYKEFKNTKEKGTRSWQGNDGSEVWVRKGFTSMTWYVMLDDIFKDVLGKFREKQEAVEFAEEFMNKQKIQ